MEVICYNGDSQQFPQCYHLSHKGGSNSVTSWLFLLLLCPFGEKDESRMTGSLVPILTFTLVFLITTYSPFHCGSNFPLVGVLTSTFWPIDNLATPWLWYPSCCVVDFTMLASTSSLSSDSFLWSFALQSAGTGTFWLGRMGIVFKEYFMWWQACGGMLGYAISKQQNWKFSFQSPADFV